MRKRLLQFLACMIGSVLLLGSGGLQAQAQEQLGGPYESDENTVLLLHFDGDGTNASDRAEDAQLFGNFEFLDNSALGLGQTLYLKNDAIDDSSRAIVPHSEDLSLTDSWTIEGWVNVFTFGDEWGDHNIIPRLLFKPGVETFFLANYFVELWGTTNFFATGYFAPNMGGWPSVDTGANFSESGRWYHITFIRDAEQRVLVQMVHNEQRERIFFGWDTYPESADSVATSNAPLYIGDAGCSETGTSCEVRGWLDGAVDEIRISDVVRDFSVPPIFDVASLPNQSAELAEYPIDVRGIKVGDGSITDVTLHYDVGNGWQEVAMADVGDKTYSATIPQQPAATAVRYFISGSDSQGLTNVSPDTTGGNFHQFAVFKPNVQTLSLSFDEGTAQDASEFGFDSQIIGDVSFVDDAAVGSQSVRFENGGVIQFDSPLLTSTEMTVDFWFKADTLINETRLLIRQSEDIAPWWQPNYQVRFFPNRRAGAGSFHVDGTGWTDGALTIDSSLTADTWYHGFYVVTDDTSHFEIRDVDGNLVGAKTIATEGDPIASDGPLTLGGVNVGSADEPNVIWPFTGQLDEVTVYNYALPFTPAGQEPVEPVEPAQTLSLSFDEGFEDASTFGHELNLFGVNGDPVLSDDAAVGQNSVAFDSSIAFIEGPSKMLSSDEMTVDMWFKADEVVNETRLLIKQHSDPWWQPNYQIRFYPDNVVAAGTFHEDGSGWTDGVLQVGPIEPDTWYHAFYVVTEDTAHFEIRDLDDNLVGAVTEPVEGSPIDADGPLTFGGVNIGSTDSPQIIWPFKGKLDDVRIYNYALDFTPVAAEDEELPATVTLAQNYPNPFNPVTTINYVLPKTENVAIRVFDVLGREVATLVDEVVSVGTHTVHFDAAGLASGVYFYQLKTGSTSLTRTMLLLK